MKENNSNPQYTSNTSILKYQVNAPGYKYSLDAYCEPLYWYVKTYCKLSAKKRMQDIAHDLHIDPGLLTKKLNIKSKQHRELTIQDIESICSLMKVSLLSIIQFYEHKNIFEKKPELFDVLTTYTISDFDKMLEKQELSPIDNEEDLSKTSVFSDDSSLTPQYSLSKIDTWAKKWYFYFPSSDSTIIEHRKKNYLKGDVTPPSSEAKTRELYDLYSDDHIYSGTLRISPVYNNDVVSYHAVLEYLTNPLQNTVAHYEGAVRLSENRQAIFLTLHNMNDNDMIYIIIDTLNIESDFHYAMASVLTLSKNKSKAHRRPCSLRMILSEDIIPFGTKMYNIMCANLMMNDSIIRIDEHGYNELKKYKEVYASPALNLFLEKYPDIDTMETTSNFINVHKCAYITESLIYSLKDIEPNETLYLEALLRLHSTAAWYSKAKAVKTNELLSKFSHDMQ